MLLIYWTEARNAAQYPIVHRIGPDNKELGTNVNSTECRETLV